MLDSTKKTSIYGNRDFLELVWGNGQIHGGGGGSSNNRTQNTNSLSIGYSLNPTSHKNEDDHHVSTTTTTTTKRARLRSTSSNSLLDHHHHHHHFPSQTQKDSDIMTYSHHQSNNIGQVSSQSKSSFKSTSTNEVFFPNLRPLKDSNHMSTYTSSQNYCFPSSSSSPNFKKPRIDSGQTRVVNFSNFSIPAMFLKSTTTHQNSATNIASSSARRVVEEIKSKTAVIETVQEQSITVTKSDPAASLIEKSSAEVITNSEAVIREKRKLANTNPRAASTSVCSLEASNDPNFGSIRTFEEDTDDSTYFSDNEEETENIVREKATHRGLKRFRNAEIHNLSERRRRDKINEKIRKLKELVPNCDKVDKASMLDDAIDYLKTLKLQLEIASMGRGLCMPPMMMLPPPPHHMNAAQLMGFRPPQFTNNIIPAVLPPAGGGVKDNILQMFGFSNQIIPPAAAMPIPPNAAAAASSPFINPMMMMIGNSSYTQQPPLIMETTNNLARHMANPAGHAVNNSRLHLSKLDRRD